jgi:hypothetical protein
MKERFGNLMSCTLYDKNSPQTFTNSLPNLASKGQFWGIKTLILLY